MWLDPDLIKRQIEQLYLVCPEMQEDEVLKLDMLEGETDAHKFLGEAEERRVEASTMVDALSGRILMMQCRRARYERREQAMRNFMFKTMEAANIKKLELATATLTIRQGSRKVVITDEALLPDSCCRIKREPDKVKIVAELHMGEMVPGAELSNAEPTITIRTK